MAPVHGSDTGVLVDEFDLSAFFTQASMVKESQAVDITTFGNDDKLYLAGPGSGSISLNGLWDGDAAATDVVLDAALGTNSIITVGVGGFATLGNSCVMLQALNAGYQIRPTVTDAVRITANAEANGGIRADGKILQPLEAETGILDGTAVNNLASSAFGGFGHLHVTAFTGTSATVKIQDSPDNSVWSDLISFTSVTGVVAERIAVSGTVDQYLRAQIIDDVFTSMTLLVSFARSRRA